jgi:hypothetical protein
MIKNTVLIISNFFNFYSPRFEQLHCADFIIDDNAFFLVSWKIEKGYRLEIEALNYRTCKAAGSAYIAIPDHINQVELIIANLWKSERKKIILLRETISTQVAFFPLKKPDELTSRSVYAPAIHLSLKQPMLSDAIHNIQTPAFTINIQNLNTT